MVGDPVKEESFLKERSPINYVDAINPITNLLVIQGANDPRVAKDESDQIVKRLQDKGNDVDYMVFEDEGHGFTKYSNQIKAIKKSAEFLAERLSWWTDNTITVTQYFLNALRTIPYIRMF